MAKMSVFENVMSKIQTVLSMLIYIAVGVGDKNV